MSGRKIIAEGISIGSDLVSNVAGENPTKEEIEKINDKIDDKIDDKMKKKFKNELIAIVLARIKLIKAQNKYKECMASV